MIIGRYRTNYGQISNKYQTSIRWILDKYQMNIRRISYEYQTIIIWILDMYQTTIRWILGKYKSNKPISRSHNLIEIFSNFLFQLEVSLPLILIASMEQELCRPCLETEPFCNMENTFTSYLAHPQPANGTSWSRNWPLGLHFPYLHTFRKILTLVKPFLDIRFWRHPSNQNILWNNLRLYRLFCHFTNIRTWIQNL